MMKIFYVMPVFLSSFGCTTTKTGNLTSDTSQMCQRHLQEFTILSSTRIPKGMDIDTADQYQKSVESNVDYIQSNFIRVLASAFLHRQNDEIFPIVSRSASISNFVANDGRSDARMPRMRLDWVGDRNFLYWDENAKNAYSSKGSWSAWRTAFYTISSPRGQHVVPIHTCSGFFDAYFDSVNEALNDYRCASILESAHSIDSVYSADNLGFPKTGVFSFIRESGFDLGTYIHNHYFMTPDMKNSVESKLDSVGARLEASNEIVEKLLDSEVTLTKKIEGDWVIAHIKLNMKGICKNAHSKSDLISD